MSYWYEIDDGDDIDFSLGEEDVHILFKSDYEGNHYVSIPKTLLLEKLLPVDEKIPCGQGSDTGPRHALNTVDLLPKVQPCVNEVLQ